MMGDEDFFSGFLLCNMNVRLRKTKGCFLLAPLVIHPINTFYTSLPYCNEKRIIYLFSFLKSHLFQFPANRFYEFIFMEKLHVGLICFIISSFHHLIRNWNVRNDLLFG